jgi:pimeloyl-ACP methyl ester carboxylesterase
MATFVLLHGAASDSWYWHRVAPELEALGHDVVAPDLPCDDDSATFSDYADTVVKLVWDRPEIVLVAQSLAGFTAPLVCRRVPVELMVFVTAMVPVPGEIPGEWWDNTGCEAAQREMAERVGYPFEFDPHVWFFHDVPDDVTAEAMTKERGQSATPMGEPWPLDAWPDVPTRFLLCRDDRFFPAGFMRRVVKDRLSIVPDEIDGGHLVALSNPKELAARLDAYRTEPLR